MVFFLFKRLSFIFELKSKATSFFPLSSAREENLGVQVKSRVLYSVSSELFFVLLLDFEWQVHSSGYYSNHIMLFKYLLFNLISEVQTFLKIYNNIFINTVDILFYYVKNNIFFAAFFCITNLHLAFSLNYCI